MRPMPSKGPRSWRRPSEGHPVPQSMEGWGGGGAGGLPTSATAEARTTARRRQFSGSSKKGYACLDSKGHSVPSAEYPAFGFPLQGSLRPLP